MTASLADADEHRPRASYPTDLTDAEWHCIAPLRGRPREHPVREILDAIFYVIRGGCAGGSCPTTSGMRQGEILGLPWSRLDLTRRLVRVRQTLVLVKGGFEFGRPKTKASRRDIELRPEAVRALRFHRKHQLEERMRLGGVPEDQGLVFSSTTGTPIRRQNLHRRSFKPLLEEARLPDIRFHDLRHTFASIALSKGANINAVSKMLGHSSVRITLDVYGHLMPGMQEAALNSLDGIFS